jgi:hypothetical protein
MTLTPEIQERMKELWNAEQSRLQVISDPEDKKGQEHELYIQIHEKIIDEFDVNIPWSTVMKMVKPPPPIPSKTSGGGTIQEKGPTVIPVGRAMKGTKALGITVSDEVKDHQLTDILLTASVHPKEAVGIVQGFLNTEGTPEDLVNVLRDSASVNWQQQKGIVRQLFDDSVVKTLFSGNRIDNTSPGTDIQAMKRNLRDEVEYHQLMSMKDSLTGNKGQDFDPMKVMVMKSMLESDGRKSQADPITMMKVSSEIAERTKGQTDVQMRIMEKMMDRQAEASQKSHEKTLELQQQVINMEIAKLQEAREQQMSPQEQVAYAHQQIQQYKDLGLIPRSNNISVGMSDTEAGVTLSKAKMTKDMLEQGFGMAERRLGSIEGMLERIGGALLTMTREQQIPKKGRGRRTPEEDDYDEETEEERETRIYERFHNNVRIHGRENQVREAVNRTAYAKRAFGDILEDD